KKRLDLRIRQSELLKFLLRRAEPHRHAPAHFAIYLQNDARRVLLCELRIEAGPSLPEHRALPPEPLPQLLGQIRRKWTQEKRKRRKNLSESCVRQFRLLLVQCIDQLHERRNRRIEVPAI